METGSPTSFSMFKFGLGLMYFILCYESIMVFAPGGDGGDPHRPASVVMGTTVFVILTVSIVRPLVHKCLVVV